jgi:hypothetical protein
MKVRVDEPHRESAAGVGQRQVAFAEIAEQVARAERLAGDALDEFLRIVTPSLVVDLRPQPTE